MTDTPDLKTTACPDCGGPLGADRRCGDRDCSEAVDCSDPVQKPTPVPPLTAREAALIKAVLSFDRAQVELRRATDAGTQPRQQKAGDRLYFARLRMVNLAKDIANGKRL